jgi:hypothetical protein
MADYAFSRQRASRLPVSASERREQPTACRAGHSIYSVMLFFVRALLCYPLAVGIVNDFICHYLSNSRSKVSVNVLDQ